MIFPSDRALLTELLRLIQVGNEGGWSRSWNAATIMKARKCDGALSRLLAQEGMTEEQRDTFIMNSRLNTHYLSYEVVAEKMRGQGNDPDDCDLGDVLCAVRKLGRAYLDEELQAAAPDAEGGNT